MLAFLVDTSRVRKNQFDVAPVGHRSYVFGLSTVDNFIHNIHALRSGAAMTYGHPHGVADELGRARRMKSCDQLTHRQTYVMSHGMKRAGVYVSGATAFQYTPLENGEMHALPT